MNVTKFFAAAFLAATIPATAGNIIDVKGDKMTLDTIFHAKVGPGTTHTQLHLEGNVKLDVFYLTIDRTTPGVSIRAVSATDMLAGNERTSQMAERKSKNGLHYFAGTNADFYFTGGTSTNGKSIVGTPVGACVIDGETFRTAQSDYQFSIDDKNIARVCRMDFYTGTAKSGDKTTLFKAINTTATAPNNGVSLFTSRFWGSTNNTDIAGNCAEVTARLVDGDKFTAGGKYRLEVTSTPTSTGDLAIPDGQFVILGRGTSTTGGNIGAKPFVESLKPGDIVEFDDVILTPEGQRVAPVTMVSGNPKNVGGGLTLDTEGERGDASSRHPRTGIGFSEDGNKIIMMVIDGRGLSAGVSTSMLADVMRYAGAHEGVNLDGGGSSTLYTRAFGVRNRTSDGNERSVSNAIFAVMEAPDNDTEVAELSFRETSVKIPRFGSFSPTVFAYNKYGLVIDTDFKDFTLSAPEALGTVTEDGKTLFASGTGTHALTANFNGVTCTIPVTIDSDANVEAKYKSVILDTRRKWSVDLQAEVNGEMMSVSPGSYEWISNNPDIVTVTPDGIVSGVTKGTATITGSRGDKSTSVEIVVEPQTEPTLALDPNFDPSTWSFSNAGIDTYTLTSTDNGFNLDYTLKSARSFKIAMSKHITTWSNPDRLELTLDTKGAKVNSFDISVRAANGKNTIPVKFTSIASDKPNKLSIPMSTFGDAAYQGIYPITLSSITITPGDKAKAVCHLEVSDFVAAYDNTPGGVDGITTDTTSLTVENGMILLPATASSVEIFDLAGRTVAKAAATQAVTAPEASGVYVVRAVIDGETLTAKVKI